ncbi:MAG: hypothetical protein K8F91_05205, partial [Candidatus Obscuribacterales bacterium]|nr:hypothetical protein [Candidatus Obscuribacterales bacterium]
VYVMISANNHYFEKLPELIQANPKLFSRVHIETPGRDKKQDVWSDDYINIIPYLKHGQR